ncbi:MAG: hypothetical protein ACLRT5_16140 [Lachnospiraceae bacterium]
MMEKNERELKGYRPPVARETESLKPFFRETVGKRRRRMARSRSGAAILAVLLMGGGLVSDTGGTGGRIICWGLAVILAFAALRFSKSAVTCRRIEQKGLRGEYQLLYCYPLTFSPHPDNPNVSYVRVRTEYGEICSTEMEIDSSVERRFRREGKTEKMILVTMPEERWTSVTAGRQME